MNMGVAVLKPYLARPASFPRAPPSSARSSGDLHDIGKNLVKMMLEGKGITVVDLGTDVSPEAFVDAAIENKAQLICCSALLTTTMGEMRNVVECAKEKGIRDQGEDHGRRRARNAELLRFHRRRLLYAGRRFRSRRGCGALLLSGMPHAAEQ
jgi:hypothetical protein